MIKETLTYLSKRLLAIVLIFLAGFITGSQATQDSAVPAPTVQIQTVAGETTPGPFGSGVLGDWSTLSHGLYCFQPNGTVTSYTRATKATTAKSSAAMACAGEDVRLYGDSITFGGKSAFAAEMSKLGLTTYIDAWSGRPTTPAVDALVAETVLPNRIIMAVGTNDIFNPSVMAAQVVRAKNFVANYNLEHGTDVRLYWVDVQATRWGQTDVIERNDQRNSMAVNMAIYQNMGTDHVLQWSARFLANPALLTTYLVDGVHLKTTPTNQYPYWAAILRGWLDLLGGI
jgi:hypothetical protein